MEFLCPIEIFILEFLYFLLPVPGFLAMFSVFEIYTVAVKYSLGYCTLYMPHVEAWKRDILTPTQTVNFTGPVTVSLLGFGQGGRIHMKSGEGLVQCAGGGRVALREPVLVFTAFYSKFSPSHKGKRELKSRAIRKSGNGIESACSALCHSVCVCDVLYMLFPRETEKGSL